MHNAVLAQIVHVHYETIYIRCRDKIEKNSNEFISLDFDFNLTKIEYDIELIDKTKLYYQIIYSRV